MQILVFGKDGQLGKAFRKLFDEALIIQRHIQVRYVGRDDCDLANADAITALLEQVRPNLIINAAAYTAVDRAEGESSIAHQINALAPQTIAQYAANQNAVLLHYSTDYVFDGSKSGFYLESDIRNPLGEYGKSKAAGEIAIENVFKQVPNGQYAIFRTSWVYGEGGNFIKTILRLAKERNSLRIIEDQYGVPTSAEWLAAISLDLIFNTKWQLQRFVSGIYHAVPSGETSWYQLACHAVMFANEAGARLKVSVADIEPIATSEYPTPAPRPKNSRMSADKLKQAIAIQNDVSKLQRWSISWADQVRSYVQQLIKEQII